MRGKISPAIKQKAVKKIESGRLSQSEAARRLCVDGETVRSWLTAYRSEGNAGLEYGGKNRIYSVQTKQQAVEAYLTGQYSLQKIYRLFFWLPPTSFHTPWPFRLAEYIRQTRELEIQVWKSALLGKGILC